MDITFVLTTCGRPDLLEKTIDSFIQFNTYQIKRYIISEDSGIKGINDKLVEKYSKYNIEWINNSIPLGQIKTIDNMYANIDTKYIFHCEEDWLFSDYGFIEKSLKILEENNQILQVWLRAQNDTNGHPIIPYNTEYDLVKVGWINGWSGFSFNPGLRRLSDYRLIGTYQSLSNDKDKSITTELKTSILYAELGYKVAILKSKYVEHIGYDRHVKQR